MPEEPNNDATQSLADTADTEAAERARFGPPATAGEIGTLGPYRLAKELGRGGMGVVYAALDTRLDRPLAIKVMLPQYAADKKAKDRFVREARATAKVTHDNVVIVYEADEHQGVPYIAMQYLEGVSLDTFLKTNGPPSLAELLRIGIETAHGLAAAHKKGLVHRDIKPGNLWLEAPTGRVKVLDFGLAKPITAETELTASGAVVGTPNYMSPEQARGEEVDQRSDLFSLGVVLYRLCTGQLPFKGPNTMAVLMALGTEEPKSVSECNHNIPPSLARLIQELLAKRAEDRPPTATIVAERLQAIAQENTLASTVAAPNPFAGIDAPEASTDDSTELLAPKQPQRRFLWVGVALVAVVLVAIVGIVLSKNNVGPLPKTDNPEPPVAVKPNTNPNNPAPKEKPKDTPQAADADRYAAEWVIRKGGKVQVNGSDVDIDKIADLPTDKFTLTVINFYLIPVGDEGFEFLKDLRGLKELTLSNTQVSNAVLVHIKDLKSLTGVWLANTKVTNAGLAHLKDLRGLTNLVLTGTAVSNEGLANLSELKNLTGLFLDGTKVTDAGLQHLKELTSLVSLGLQSTAVTDTGLLQLVGFANLKEVLLSGTGVTDTGLSHLLPLKNLTRIWLSGTKVSDKGIPQLKTLKKLTDLHLQMTPVTAQGAVELHNVLPTCNIDYTGGTLPAKK